MTFRNYALSYISQSGQLYISKERFFTRKRAMLKANNLHNIFLYVVNLQELANAHDRVVRAQLSVVKPTTVDRVIITAFDMEKWL